MRRHGRLGGYDVGFARELEFDYFAFSSNIRNKG